MEIFQKAFVLGKESTVAQRLIKPRFHTLLWPVQSLLGPQHHHLFFAARSSLALFGERLIMPFPKVVQSEQFHSLQVLIHF